MPRVDGDPDPLGRWSLQSPLVGSVRPPPASGTPVAPKFDHPSGRFAAATADPLAEIIAECVHDGVIGTRHAEDLGALIRRTRTAHDLAGALDALRGLLYGRLIATDDRRLLEEVFVELDDGRRLPGAGSIVPHPSKTARDAGQDIFGPGASLNRVEETVLSVVERRALDNERRDRCRIDLIKMTDPHELHAARAAIRLLVTSSAVRSGDRMLIAASYDHQALQIGGSRIEVFAGQGINMSVGDAYTADVELGFQRELLKTHDPFGRTRAGKIFDVLAEHEINGMISEQDAETLARMIDARVFTVHDMRDLFLAVRRAVHRGLFSARARRGLENAILAKNEKAGCKLVPTRSLHVGHDIFGAIDFDRAHRHPHGNPSAFVDSFVSEGSADWLAGELRIVKDVPTLVRIEKAVARSLAYGLVGEDEHAVVVEPLKEARARVSIIDD